MSSKRETILEYIKTYLKTEITTVNGYNFTLHDVYRTFKHWDQQREFPILCVLDGDEDIKHDANEQLERTMYVEIIGYVIIDDREEDHLSAGTEVNKLLEDTMNALYKNWESIMINSNCRYIKFVRVNTDLGMIHPKGAFALTCEIKYIHELGHA